MSRSRTIEWATQLERYQKGNYQLQSFSYSARLDPALSYESVTGPKAKQPRKVWDNPEAQELLEKSMDVTRPAERQKLFDELHRRQIDDVPIIVLYNNLDTSRGVQAHQGLCAWYREHAAAVGSVGAVASTRHRDTGPMLLFVLKRLLSALPTLFLVALAVFALVRAVPGDPALAHAGRHGDGGERRRSARRDGARQAVPVQFAIWLATSSPAISAHSIQIDAPVLPLLFERFAVTAAVVVRR